MGVFGAATAGIFRSKQILPESIRRTEVAWMLGLAAAQVALDQIVPHVAVFAHLGGLVAGMVLGLIIPLRKRN
jgi:membrane associated rhomboid family serine protease